MKLSFFGAAKAVTGSCHCLEVNGKKVLIDCGLQQGRDDFDNSVLDFPPNYIDYVIVTHAHIDHSGRLPLLVRLGFKGQIITTRLTAELLKIMLLDSAHIQESDAEWQNQKGRRAGRETVVPLYTTTDAQAALEQLTAYEYGETVELFEGLKIRFTDAGHLLGSAYVEAWLSENGTEKKIVFSGDIGNINQPIIRDPQPISEADYIVMESTYGDRNHDTVSGYYTRDLAAIFDKTFARGGSVIIPSFAVGRTQELLYFIHEMKEKHMVSSFPDFAVYVDSPLAGAATKIFSGDLTGYLDEDAIRHLREDGDLFDFPGLTISESLEDSKALNADRTPKVIISASGMCDAGRIRHHLKHNLWRPECTVVFVGFQGPDTLGRRLLDGVKSIKLFGEEISVKAQIVNFQGLSSHADRDHLIAWAKAFQPVPKQIFVVHGEADTTVRFAETLNGLGIPAHSPNYEEVYDLFENKMLAPGIIRKKPETEFTHHASDAYSQLEAVSAELQQLIKNSAGRTNKDLRWLTEQLGALMHKFNA